MIQHEICDPVNLLSKCIHNYITYFTYCISIILYIISIIFETYLRHKHIQYYLLIQRVLHCAHCISGDYFTIRSQLVFHCCFAFSLESYLGTFCGYWTQKVFSLHFALTWSPKAQLLLLQCLHCLLKVPEVF